MLSSTPAAIADPITPATFGPMACIKRKFLGLALWPSIWATLAAIGTADTPAAPIRGLILPPVILFISLARSTPPAVPHPKATMPRAMILIVCQVRKVPAVAVAAYSYMALVPVIQPPIMRALTTKKEREIVMEQLRPVTRREKIIFPIVVTVLVSALLPSLYNQSLRDRCLCLRMWNPHK